MPPFLGRQVCSQAGRTQFRQQPPWQGFASIQLAEMTVRLADFSLGDMAKKYRIAHFARSHANLWRMAMDRIIALFFIMKSALELTQLLSKVGVEIQIQEILVKYGFH